MTRMSESTRGRSVLEGSFAVLEALEKSTDYVGLTALASASRLPKATAHRMLEQLAALGAVEQRCGRYRIGARMFQLGQAWRPHRSLEAAGRHPLRQLAVMTKTGVTLTVLYDNETLLVAAEPGMAGFVIPAAPGMTFPLFTAAGKALAIGRADLTAPQPYSPHGWTRALAEVRRRGVALEREEVLPHVACVAAPVYSPTGRVVASVSAVIDANRSFAPMIQPVQQAARAIADGLARSGLGPLSGPVQASTAGNVTS